MDIYIFIATIIGSLAWPIASVIIVIILKKPISKLLQSIKKLKYKDAEFDFGKEIVKISEGKEPLNTPLSYKSAELAELSPKGAVLEAWLSLEQTMIDALGPKATPKDAFSMAQGLRINGKLSSSSYERLQRLRKLRNIVVHIPEHELTTDEAESFIRLVNDLRLEINNA